MKYFIVLLFLLLSPGVLAISISINPASITLTDLQRGGYAEDVILISTGSEDDVQVTMFNEQNDTVFEWLRFEPEDTSFTINQDEPHELKVIVEPPADTPNGLYTGAIRFRIEADQGFVGQTGSVIELGVAAYLSFEISDDEIIKCTVFGYDLENVEQGDDLDLELRLINNGNIRLNPLITVDVWNKAQTRIEKTITSDEQTILPTVRDVFNVAIPTNDLDADQYFADITVDVCDYEETSTFDVLLPGSLTVSGRLIKIENKVWNNVEDTIKTSAFFENTGDQEVSAEFRGGIYLDDTLIEDFRSGYRDIEIGKTASFPVEFVPKEPGRYVVKGRVYYENKQTFEKSNIINVNPKGIEYDGTGSPVDNRDKFPYGIIIFAVVVLVLLILIKKKKTKSKI